jgi:hypothetical protein
MKSIENNPDKKSLIERLDNSLLEFNKKLAIKWMHKTNQSKKTLETELFVASGAMLTFGSFEGAHVQYNDLVMAGVCFLQAGSRSEDYQEIKSNKFIKYAFGPMYLMDAAITIIGITGLISSLISPDPDGYKSSLQTTSFGLGMLGWITANYISRVDINNNN